MGTVRRCKHQDARIVAQIGDTCPECNQQVSAGSHPKVATTSEGTASTADPGPDITFSGILRFIGWSVIAVGVFAGIISAQPAESYGDPNLILGWTVFGACFSSGLLWVSLGRMLKYLKEISTALGQAS